MKRRSFITALGLTGAAAPLLHATRSIAKDREKPVFVLVHGAWHGAWCWSEMTLRLAKAGYASVSVDLPGAGSQARFPQAFFNRPFSSGAFATEKSPNAGVTQEERTSAVVEAVKSAASLGSGKVVLVGHSLGGLTVSRVAEAVPELLQSVIYLSAWFLPNGMRMGQFRKHPSFSASRLGPLYSANPKNVGAIRLDTRSQDPDYVAGLKEAFYADVDDAHLAAIANMLHCDEPASVAGVPMAITSEKFGTVERHYIRMGDDNAIPPAAQDAMIKMVDSSGVGGKTIVHKMGGSHSPFHAQPDALLDVLAKIAT